MTTGRRNAGDTRVTWPESQWRAFLCSFDVDELTHVSSSALLGIGCIGAVSGVLAVAGYVPSIARISQFSAPGLCIGLNILGGACTFTAGRLRYRGILAGLLALFDNVFYSTALALAAVTSANGFDVGFAAVHGLMLVGFITQLYSLTVLLGLGIAVPPVALIALFRPAAAVSVIIVCSCLMAFLLMYQTGKRQEVIRGARRLEAELKESLAQLRVAEERERIARDLHDGVGSQLAGLIWRVRGLAAALPAPTTRVELQKLERRVLDTIEEMRDVVLALRREPVSWDETTALLTQRCREMCGNIHLDLAVGGAPSPATLHAVFPDLVRIVFELVRNAARHAAPSKVEVRIEATDAVRLVVLDDGRGLQSADVEKSQGGLSNVRRRVDDLGGRVEMASDARGTRVEIVLPPVKHVPSAS